MLVHVVEEGLADSPEAELLVRHYLSGRPEIDSLVMGCTHYPLLRGVIQRAVGDEVRLVDSAEVTAERVSATFGPPRCYREGRIIHYVTGDPVAFAHTAKVIGGVAGEIVTVEVGQTARLDIGMEVGSVEQSVEVTAAIPLLQTESASVGQVIEQAAVNALPLNGRNFVQLAILAPGVSGLDYAQSGTINTGKRPDELRPGGTAIQPNGALSQSNQVLLDGVDNTEMISQTFIVLPSGGGDPGIQGNHQQRRRRVRAERWSGSGGDFKSAVTTFTGRCSNSCATNGWMQGTFSRVPTVPSRPSS